MGATTLSRTPIWAALAAALLGCQSARISSAIQRELATKGTVDLSIAVPGEWQRVCVLGPYSNNETASQTLGFAWNVESRSSIRSSDGISVLAFVEGNEVVAYAEHERRFGDFAGLSGRCFVRARAKFAKAEGGNRALLPVD